MEHFFYEPWTDGDDRRRLETDPAGNPLSPYHPWNKDTKPKPTGRTWREKYTWDTAPRWDRTVMETGCYARIWTPALARKMPENPFIVSTGHSLRMLLPKSRPTLAEMEMESGGGVSLVQKLLDGYDALIVVDAVQGGGAPGTVYLLEPQLPDTLPHPTDELDALLGHLCDAQLSRLFILAKALGVLPPKVIMVGCQPHSCDELSSGLSRPVQKGVDLALQYVQPAFGKLNGAPSIQIGSERRR